MSRSRNSRRGLRPQLRTRPHPYGEEPKRRAFCGAPTAGIARRVQAADAHVADTSGAPDGGHFCRYGCCGMIDPSGAETHGIDLAFVSAEDEWAVEDFLERTSGV